MQLCEVIHRTYYKCVTQAPFQALLMVMLRHRYQLSHNSHICFRWWKTFCLICFGMTHGRRLRFVSPYIHVERRYFSSLTLIIFISPDRYQGDILSIFTPLVFIFYLCINLIWILPPEEFFFLSIHWYESHQGRAPSSSIYLVLSARVGIQKLCDVWLN